MLKYEDVRWVGAFKGADPPHAAQIVVIYRNPETGEKRGVHLMRFSGSYSLAPPRVSVNSRREHPPGCCKPAHSRHNLQRYRYPVAR